MSDPLVIRVLFPALLLVFVGHRAYYTRKYPPQETETIKELAPSLRSKLAALLFILALAATVTYLIVPDLLAFATFPVSPLARWIGLAFAAAGFILLEASQRALSANWSDQPRITASQVLVTAGPYRIIRHPIYSAFFLILGSSLLISSNLLVGLLWISAVGLDVSERIPFEEKSLRERFGQDYLQYKKSTGSLLPRI